VCYPKTGVFEPCRVSHALPTSDPDLAFIVGLWDRLADECKARLIEVIRENLPSETLPTLSDQRSAVNDRNHREGQMVQMNPLSKGC
jgi:hypothetical protein